MGKFRSLLANFLGVKSEAIAGKNSGERRNPGRLEDKLAIDASSLSCGICFSIFTQPPKLLPCGHSICCACLPRLQSSEFLNYGNCPFCRAPFRPDRLAKNFALETVFDGVTVEIEDLYKDAVDRGVRTSDATEGDVAFRSLVDGNLLYDYRRMKMQKESLTADLESAKRQIEDLQTNVKCWAWGSVALLALVIYAKLSQSIPL